VVIAAFMWTGATQSIKATRFRERLPALPSAVAAAVCNACGRRGVLWLRLASVVAVSGSRGARAS
jgi:hypothetical protein